MPVKAQAHDSARLKQYAVGWGLKPLSGGILIVGAGIGLRLLEVLICS